MLFLSLWISNLSLNCHLKVMLYRIIFHNVSNLASHIIGMLTLTNDTGPHQLKYSILFYFSLWIVEKKLHVHSAVQVYLIIFYLQDTSNG